MSKKHKKKRKALPQEKQQKAKETKTLSNLQAVVCVKCSIDDSAQSIDTCKACQWHKEDNCTYTKPEQKIEVVSFGTPMRYNRNFFQMSSEGLREQSLNYYITTDIMNEVRRIEGYPHYRQLKNDLLSGVFKKEKEEKKPIVLKAEEIIPMHFLAMQNSGPDQYDMLVDGKSYYLTDGEKNISGEWTILFHLYRVYEYDGFSDIVLDGQPYRLLFQEAHSPPDMIVAQQEDRIIIGRRKAHESKSRINVGRSVSAVGD